MQRVTTLIGFFFLLLIGCTPISTPVSESPTRFPPQGDSDQWENLFDRQVIGQPPVSGCSNCHSIDGETTLVGPSLPNFSSYQANHLLESIIDPTVQITEGFSGGMIDGYAESLTEQEIADLVAYLQTFENQP